MNREWKKGYEEGFAAGWKAAKVEVNYVNISGASSYVPQTFATMADQPYNVKLNQTKTEKVICNLTDHTRIV